MWSVSGGKMHVVLILLALVCWKYVGKEIFFIKV